MNEKTIVCPNCKTEISLTGADSDQIGEQLVKQLESDKESQLREARQKLADELNKISLEIEELKAQICSKSGALHNAIERELELREIWHELNASN